MKNVKTLTKAELEMMKENMDIYVSEGYTITAQKPVIGNVYHNFLENVDYCATENDTDKVLLIGTVGEPWFADINKVLKDYANIDGTDLIISDITSEPIRIIRKTSYNAAIQLAEDTDVITSKGHVLHAKEGDFLVCSTKLENGVRIPDDAWGYWTINRNVFYNTNELIGGKCGDEIYWIVDKDKILTIGGTGTIYDYDIIYEEWERGHDTAYSPIATKAPWLSFNIKTVIIEDGVENISDNAFYFCKNIENIIIPDSIVKIGKRAFKECRNLISINIPYSVTSIEDEAFEYCSGLTSITIPDSVTEIGNWAFNGCKRLTSITIGNRVGSIGNSAFSGCESLTSVTIPDSVTSIGDYAFAYCSDLINIQLSDNIMAIGSDAFDDCNSLLNVCVSNLSVWCNIDFHNSRSNPLCNGAYLFVEYSHKYKIVTDLIIPDGLTTIKPFTFCNYSYLKKVIIGNSVTSIEKYAFFGCDNLENITIPDNIINVGSYAFSECGLKTIEIPYNTTNIGYRAFDGCSNLTNIQVNDKNKIYSSIDGVLFNKDQTELIVYPSGKFDDKYIIPDTVTRIEQYAFYKCNNLKNIIIQNNITVLLSNTFYECDSLTTVTIPTTMKNIMREAFYYCNDFKIDYKGTKEQWENINNSCYLAKIR